ncbi:MAG TPA: response regulator transcription factor [Bacteroidales bacterium]|nr:response regulator transcription factor [Bacteroidales bacterium]
MIRLFTIEDHPVIITGLRNTFRPSRDGIEIIGSANNVDEAIEAADPLSFDVFLLDLYIPGYQPLQSIKKIKEHFPGKPIVMFTSEDSTIWQRKMFEAGAMAYLLKNAEKNEIRLTLEKVSQGMTVFTGMIEPEREQTFRAGFADPKYILTPNQKEYVVFLSNGLTQQEIAEKKSLSISTVEKTIKNIREKCSARNNAELVKILLERGII